MTLANHLHAFAASCQSSGEHGFPQARDIFDQQMTACNHGGQREPNLLVLTLQYLAVRASRHPPLPGALAQYSLRFRLWETMRCGAAPKVK